MQWIDFNASQWISLVISRLNMNYAWFSGVNKVRTYKPVSFSIIGGTTSPVPTNQNTAAFRTSSSFVGSTQQNVDTGAVSVTSVTTTLTTSSTVTSAVESKETGKNTTTNNETFSSPSYSNFNGNSSVIINASSPGSAYTSITMNSRRGKINGEKAGNVWSDHNMLIVTYRCDT